jgi:hypothetical protein
VRAFLSDIYRNKETRGKGEIKKSETKKHRSRRPRMQELEAQKMSFRRGEKVQAARPGDRPEQKPDRSQAAAGENWRNITEY